MRLSLPILFFATAIQLFGSDLKYNAPSSKAKHELGQELLKDPAGNAHSLSHMGEGRVTVVIFSVPDMSQGPSQRRWSRFLAIEPDSRLNDNVALILVENMSEAGPFKEQARHDMREQFAVKKRPFLLLDETGSIFQRFQVPRDSTQILVFDRTGVLRDVESEFDNQQAAIQRIREVVQKLSDA